MPLNVWATKGFDAEDIVKKHLPEDHRVCRVLGDVYRVEIMSKGQRGSLGTRSTHTVDILPRERAAKRKRDGDYDESKSAAQRLEEAQASVLAAKKEQKEESKVVRVNAVKLATLEKVSAQCVEILADSESLTPTCVKQMNAAMLKLNDLKNRATAGHDIAEEAGVLVQQVKNAIQFAHNIVKAEKKHAGSSED